jgi:hypothetical protein
MNDVAGETAEAEREAAGEIEKGAGGEEDRAEDEEGAAEVAGGVHEGDVSRWRAHGRECALVCSEDRLRSFAALQAAQDDSVL